MKRRTFLLSAAGGAGALLIGWGAWQRATQLPPGLPPGTTLINGWIELTADGHAVLAVPRAEMGQGIHSALAMLAAEELDLPLAQVQILEAPVGRIFARVMRAESLLPRLFPNDSLTARAKRELRQIAGKPTMGVSGSTGGSTTISDLWLRIRTVAAHARAVLVQAAARANGVPSEQCRTESGAVVLPDGRRIPYAELVKSAASFSSVGNFGLKDMKTFSLVGRPTNRIDAAEACDGRLKFAGDIRMPGLRYAALAMPPSLQARMVSFTAPAGVQVVKVPAGHGHGEALAVVATSWWAASQAAEKLAVVWDRAADAGVDTARISAARQQALASDAGVVHSQLGDPDAAFASAARTVSATYDAPYVSHAQLETTTCTALVADGMVRIWGPSQAPSDAIAAAARAAGVGVSQVELNVPRIGGGFGRRLDSDVVFQAAAIAAQLPGTPVQLMWSREQDMRHDFYRAAASAQLRAAIDATGNVVALDIAVASQSIGTAREARIAGGTRKPATAGKPRNTGLGYAIAHQRRRLVEAPGGLPVGSWRSVGDSVDGFFIESFIDELAGATGRDPLALRQALLAGRPRHLQALALAVEKSGYSADRQAQLKTSGRAMGLAIYEANGSVVAEVAEVSIDGSRPKVHRVVCAIHCGLAVNPNIIAQQIEGAVIMGIGAALDPGIEVRDGRVVQENYHDYPLPLMADTPAIETHIVPSTDAPTGVGEPGLPPVAAAIANAVFALTGKRLRSLPLRVQAA